MKKFLLILPLLTMISCVYNDQKIPLNFDLNNQISTIGGYKGVELLVIDNRINRPLIGRKKFSSDEEIEIVPTTDLSAFLQQKITQNLLSRGFQYGKDKMVQIYIESFFYEASRNIMVGNSGINAKFRVVVKDKKSNDEFVKNYEMSLNKKHFVMPLESTDELTINLFLRDMLQEILSDDNFIESLIR